MRLCQGVCAVSCSQSLPSLSPQPTECAGASTCTHHTHTHTHTPQYIYPTHILHPHTCPQRHFHSQACTPKCILIHTHLPTHIPPTPIHTEMHTRHIHPQVFTYIPCLIHFTPSKCPPVLPNSGIKLVSSALAGGFFYL